MVELNRGKKVAKPHQTGILTKMPFKKAHLAPGQKIPGLILISVNDTNLSEFLAQKVVCLLIGISYRTHDKPIA
jgi:hypothetical protein